MNSTDFPAPLLLANKAMLKVRRGAPCNGTLGFRESIGLSEQSAELDTPLELRVGKFRRSRHW